MSLTRKLHTETTESHAAQQMHSTMGLDPNLSQLNDKNLDNELTSRRADSNDADGLLKVDESDKILGEAGAQGPDDLEAQIDEARSASWGKPTAAETQQNNSAVVESKELNENQQASDADVTEGHS